MEERTVKEEREEERRREEKRRGEERMTCRNNSVTETEGRLRESDTRTLRRRLQPPAGHIAELRQRCTNKKWA